MQSMISNIAGDRYYCIIIISIFILLLLLFYHYYYCYYLFEASIETKRLCVQEGWRCVPPENHCGFIWWRKTGKTIASMVGKKRNPQSKGKWMLRPTRGLCRALKWRKTGGEVPKIIFATRTSEGGLTLLINQRSGDRLTRGQKGPGEITGREERTVVEVQKRDVRDSGGCWGRQEEPLDSLRY